MSAVTTTKCPKCGNFNTTHGDMISCRHCGHKYSQIEERIMDGLSAIPPSQSDFPLLMAIAEAGQQFHDACVVRDATYRRLIVEGIGHDFDGMDKANKIYFACLANLQTALSNWREHSTK